jgi:hypothetical protein
MKMKKMMILMLGLFFLGSAGMNAQVTIGSDDVPTPGSVLDLQSSGSLGLLLPSVTLTDATVWAPVDGSAVEGMTVFHNTDALTNGLSGKGIYVWTNGTWSRMGASATQCVDIAAAATQAGFVGNIGSGKTLEVVVNSGSAPFNYNWYKNGVPLQTVSNKTDRKDSYTATEYGTYTCEITNACSMQSISFLVTEVNVGDYNDNPSGVTWGLNGITCFDVRAGSGFPASSPYNIVVTGATVTAVTWLYDDPGIVLNGSATESSSGVTLPFNSQAVVSAAATTPLTVTVTALITLSTGDKVNVAKAIKFQNASCCEGAIITGGAFDYINSVKGDGAKNPTPTPTPNTGDRAWSPNLGITTGNGSITWGTWFNTTPVGDLCVYKKNGNSGNAVSGGWGAAVDGCASESYIDVADRTGDWYLPNEYELATIYYTLAGSTSATSSQSSFANLITAGKAVAGTEDMKTSNYYWSSTEYSTTTYANYFYFGNGYRNYDFKTLTYRFARCVRRL